MKLSFSLNSFKGLMERARRSFFFVGLISLIWFLFRTGTKPTRATYPCQKVAATNSYLWLTTFVVPFLLAVPRKTSSLREALTKRRLLLLGLIAVVTGSTTTWYIQEVMKPSEEPIVGLTLNGWVAESQPASSIFIVNGTTGYDEGFMKLINLMGEHGLPFYKSSETGLNKGPNGLITKDDVVIIKVNSQWNARGGTNTDLLKAIIEAIVNHPDGFVGEIVVADNGQDQYGSGGSGGSLDWRLNNAEDTSQSVQKVVDSFSASYKVSTYLWDTITTKRVNEYHEGDLEDGYVVNDTVNPRTHIAVSYPKFRTKYGTYISFKLGVWNPETQTYESSRLKVINVPVLKSHSGYGVTACVKHYMGVVSDKLTSQISGGRAHDSVGSGGMGTQMAATRMPTLNIIDAIWVNPVPRGYAGSGPATPYRVAVRVNVIAASTDPVALDYWAAKYVLLQTASLRGYTRTSPMDPDNTESGSFGEWLRLSMEEIKRAGYWVTLEEDHMNVYVYHMQPGNGD